MLSSVGTCSRRRDEQTDAQLSLALLPLLPCLSIPFSRSTNALEQLAAVLPAFSLTCAGCLFAAAAAAAAAAMLSYVFVSCSLAHSAHDARVHSAAEQVSAVEEKKTGGDARPHCILLSLSLE